ncbi:IS21 family transposase [Synechococcus sp. CB0101]|uniref:IS21 family transposase n=3 Tax=Synechococcus sp. CB0101 TaxID=232348 RepID=UPI0010AA27CA|nr:IS21 family transposase [Synechococcus sp. CB0101]QCH15525.1 IS21 family transposase [Synechococcus sp. CB0101]
MTVATATGAIGTRATVQLATELAATELQSALLQAITGLTQLVSQLSQQFPIAQPAATAEPWMEERPAQASQPTCVPNLSPLWDELSVVELRSLLRSYPIDRTSLPAACQATAKTGPAATRKLVHPVERARPDDTVSAGASSLEPMAAEMPVQTPQDVEAMQRLSAAGWGRRRIARELGCSPETVRKYLRQGGWQPYGKPCRTSVLDGQREWLRQRFLAHRGNADVLRQELASEKGIKVSLRTVERAVEPWRRELRNAAVATVRFETPPGRQLQADFGQCVVRIGGERVRVHLAVLTLGYSRRLLVRAFRSEKQDHWLSTLEEGFRHWGGVPQEVLVDNARALVSQHDPERQILVFAQRLEQFASYWGFKPRACRPYRARTKGKDERGVAYVKRNAMAGREFSSWAELEAHLVRWTREVADLRVHGTTGEAPLERFMRAEAQALQPLEAKPSFLAERELVRVVHSDCCVEVEANWYSAPQALIRQRVSVLVRDQQVLIRHGGRIVAEHRRQRPGSRSRQVIDGHWDGLVPQRQRREAVRSLRDTSERCDQEQEQEQERRMVRSSELARPLAVYAELIGEVAA